MTASPDRCNHRVFDLARFTSRPCNGKAVATEPDGARCKRHTVAAIAEKRAAAEARVARKVAGVLQRTKHLTDEL